MPADFDITPDVLNEHQRRHFAVLLASLEETLQRIEELSEPSSASRSLSAIDEDLPAGFAGAVAPYLAEARERLERVVEQLALEPRRISKRRTIRALLTATIVRFEDSSPAQLRGYGAVDPRFVQTVAPAFDAIADLLRAMSSLLSAHGRPTNPPD